MASISRDNFRSNVRVCGTTAAKTVVVRNDVTAKDMTTGKDVVIAGDVQVTGHLTARIDLVTNNATVNNLFATLPKTTTLTMPYTRAHNEWTPPKYPAVSGTTSSLSYAMQFSVPKTVSGLRCDFMLDDDIIGDPGNASVRIADPVTGDALLGTDYPVSIGTMPILPLDESLQRFLSSRFVLDTPLAPFTPFVVEFTQTGDNTNGFDARLNIFAENY